MGRWFEPSRVHMEPHIQKAIIKYLRIDKPVEAESLVRYENVSNDWRKFVNRVLTVRQGIVYLIHSQFPFDKYPVEEYQVVEPFAVTPNVEVGDHVVCFQDGVHLKEGIVEKIAGGCPKIQGEDDFYQVFKILGELSSKAHWVKQDQEIEGRIQDYVMLDPDEGWQRNYHIDSEMDKNATGHKRVFEVQCSQCLHTQ